MIRTLASRLALLVLAGLSVGLAIPAAAAANDSAAVVNGVVVVQGDSGPNSIGFQSGVSNGYYADASANAATGPAVFFKVVYQGSGQYAANGSASCASDSASLCYEGPVQEDATFDSWSVTFPAVELGVGGVSGSAPASEQQVAFHSDQSDTACPEGLVLQEEFPCQAEDCSASYGVDPGSPPIALDGSASGGTLNLRVEAPWHLQVADFSCVGLVMTNPPLRDLLRAVTKVPLAALASDAPVTIPVSSADPGAYQLSADCTAEAQAKNSDVMSCTQALNWSGTVTITPDCITGSGSDAPWCIRKQQKDEAQKAANDWQARFRQLTNLAAELGCTGPAGTVNADTDTKYACALQNLVRGTAESMAKHYQALANDPPDSNFTSVGKPAPVELPKLAVRVRRAPDFVLLARNYARIASLIQALVTAQNRATGAFLAMTNGDSAASSDLQAQDSAVLPYAGQAARILQGQHTLAVSASAELRRIGPHCAQLALTIVAPDATHGDGLGIGALAGIGH